MRGIYLFIYLVFKPNSCLWSKSPDSMCSFSFLTENSQFISPNGSISSNYRVMSVVTWPNVVRF